MEQNMCITKHENSEMEGSSETSLFDIYIGQPREIAGAEVQRKLQSEMLRRTARTIREDYIKMMCGYSSGWISQLQMINN